MSRSRSFLRSICYLFVLTFIATAAFAQTPSSTLLILAKSDNTVAIVDPATLKVLARIPAGPDPHEIIASEDGKLAYVSNYGGVDSTLNTISVVDLIKRKALPPINLGALHSTHGLDFASGKLYFTAETNKDESQHASSELPSTSSAPPEDFLSPSPTVPTAKGFKTSWPLAAPNSKPATQNIALPPPL